MSREALDQAAQTIKDQQKELERIAAAALELGTVVSQDNEYAFISVRGSILRVGKPKFKLKNGVRVWVQGDSKQIIDEFVEIGTGSTAIVIKSAKDRSEVGGGTGSFFVLNGEKQPKDGDRVILDDSNSVIVENLGQTEKFDKEEVPQVTWNDIGGLDEAKAQMIEAVELPHKNAEILKFYGKKQIKGILLYGPPGCGKTMLGKAAANSLAKIYDKKDSASGFMYIKGPEILNKFVGESEATVRSIFSKAKVHFKTHGYPAVIFIDEADAILGKRGQAGSSFMSNTIVPMFLTEMDGLEDSGALVILATNRPDVLDPAIVRDGRIDRKIKVTRPSVKDAYDIVKMHLDGKPILKGETEKELAKTLIAEFYAENRILYKINLTDSEFVYMTMAQIVNGAMLVGIVESALSKAIRRDLATGKRSGLSVSDLTEAVNMLHEQNSDIDHTYEIDEFVHPIRKQVKNVERYHQIIGESHAEAA